MAPAGAAPLSEFELEVPANAHPGVTQLSFQPPGCDYQLVLGVPENWSLGDSLIVFKNANDQWQLKIVAKAKDDVRDDKPRQVKFFIPVWAVPGESKFKIDAGGGEILNVATPEFARPGDQMVFSYEKNGWIGSVTKDRFTRSKMPEMGNLRDMRSWKVPPMDLDTNYVELLAAVRAAGGYFSPKLERAALPPLYIPGIAATESIKEGEVLCRVPRRLHVTSQAANRIHPQLKAQLESNEKMKDDLRIQKTDSAVLLAQLIFRAECRAIARQNGDVVSGVVDPLEGAAIDADVLRVWDSYADGLMGTDLSFHTYLRAARDSNAVQTEFRPSTQADLILDGAGNMNDVFERIRTHCTAADIGSALDDALMFVQARLCTMTRVFDVNSSPSMVPLGDLFNHSSRYGVRWGFNEAEDAMEYVAVRPHSKGEEVFISYGSTSNSKLHRGYGFTLPPKDEESWGYELRRERVHAIMDAFVPEKRQLAVVALDTMRIEETLAKLLNAVADAGSDPADFLALSCCRCKAEYDADSGMQPYLQALQRARSKRSPSCSWWEELSDDEISHASSDPVRVKMCEYLCLVAHIEAVMVWQGLMLEENCLEKSADFREVVAEALNLLKDGSRILIKSEAS